MKYVLDASRKDRFLTLLTSWKTYKFSEDNQMSTETLTDSDAKRELAETIDRLKKGIRDPEAIRRANERMDRMREEIRQRCGILNVAVDLVREARDS